MRSVKNYLEDIFLNKRVKIGLGLHLDGVFIVGTVTGFRYRGTSTELLILLKDVSVSHVEYKDYLINGHFNEMPFHIETEIEILRDANLESLLN